MVACPRRTKGPGAKTQLGRRGRSTLLRYLWLDVRSGGGGGECRSPAERSARPSDGSAGPSSRGAHIHSDSPECDARASRPPAAVVRSGHHARGRLALVRRRLGTHRAPRVRQQPIPDARRSRREGHHGRLSGPRRGMRPGWIVRARPGSHGARGLPRGARHGLLLSGERVRRRRDVRVLLRRRRLPSHVRERPRGLPVKSGEQADRAMPVVGAYSQVSVRRSGRESAQATTRLGEERRVALRPTRVGG
jgi:hypothetical protein